LNTDGEKSNVGDGDGEKLKFGDGDENPFDYPILSTAAKSDRVESIL
jgi:hypothetical protein